jgi:hypothetical protein
MWVGLKKIRMIYFFYFNIEMEKYYIILNQFILNIKFMIQVMSLIIIR